MWTAAKKGIVSCFDFTALLCSDLDNVCHENAICLDGPNGTLCECRVGYEGDGIEECSSK